MSTDQTLVRAELADPNTAAARLTEIAAEHPTLAAEIAAHPNIYPGLSDWLQQYGSFAQPEPVAVEPAAVIADVEPVVAAPASETAPAAEPFDLTDILIDGAAGAVSAFDDFAMLEAVAEMSRRVRPALERLLHPGDAVGIAAPVILAGADRREALALFTQDRLIVVWGGLLAAKGELVIPYSSVQAARVGTGPSELTDHATLYLQTDSQLMLALPTDDVQRLSFLALVAQGRPLDEVAPWNNPEPVVEAAPLSPLEAELADPATAPARLAELAHSNPELHPAIAAHPAAYPDLLDWLESRDDAATKQAVEQRRNPTPVAIPTRAVATVASVAAVPVSTKTSGWEKADKALDTADKVGNVVVNIAAVIYGIFLVVVGIAIAGLGFGNTGGNGTGAGWVGVGIAIYGVYVALPLPGFKLIIW